MDNGAGSGRRRECRGTNSWCNVLEEQVSISLLFNPLAWEGCTVLVVLLVPARVAGYVLGRLLLLLLLWVALEHLLEELELRGGQGDEGGQEENEVERGQSGERTTHSGSAVGLSRWATRCVL